MTALESMAHLANLAILTALTVTTVAAQCPGSPVHVINSPEIPADVCIPEGFTAVPVDYFDDYSWRTFLAMIWPAANGQRGVPDTRKTAGGAGPRVFETYKSLWEVFHEDGSRPQARFNEYDTAGNNACKVQPAFGDLILASFSGIGDIGQAAAGELSGPLPAQNGKYVRYQTLYNQAEFDYIAGNQLYLRSKFPEVPSPRPTVPVIRFPDGSISIKAAWIEMAGLPEEIRRRYYTRAAIVRDPDTGQCSRVTVGLTGLHIVQKTPSRPQWIWSSFEQVDNVPPAQIGAPGKFTFSDGSKTAAMPGENPLPLVPLPRQPAAPFNVARSAPIHPKTVLTNFQYERLLKGTVWEYYQLVVTQWPRLEGNQAAPVPATQNGDILNTFPGTGAFSAFANLSMETFDQGRPQLGCMSCHNQARMSGDFMWSVLDHAFPAKLPVAPEADRSASTPGGAPRY
jgi:hypothetical protein